MQPYRSISVTASIWVGLALIVTGAVLTVLRNGGIVATVIAIQGFQIKTDSAAIVMMIVGLVLVLGTLFLSGRYVKLGTPFSRDESGKE